MVGMSGKSNEPRGGTSGSNVQSSKKVPASGHGKTQVSLGFGVQLILAVQHMRLWWDLDPQALEDLAAFEHSVSG
jgi:hypothetical protein